MNAMVKQEPQPEQPGLLSVILKVSENPNADIVKMQQLLDLYERMESKRAESAFNAAMAATQAEIGRVATDRHNNQTRSNYATYAAIDRAIRPIYTANGFALSFNTAEGAATDYVRLTCTASHRDGYSREYRIDMPADGKGAKGGDVMTKTHATGSATEYGRRYLVKMIFNVAIGEDPLDDDGNGAGKPHKHQDWFDKIDGMADMVEAESVRSELKSAFAGTPPKELVSRWQSVSKRIKEQG